MEIHNPPHPGEVIRELCLEPLEISVTAAARALGVTRKALSELLNGRSGVSPAMALRLAKAFDTTAESWLNLQQQYDLCQPRPNHSVSQIKQPKPRLRHLF